MPKKEKPPDVWDRYGKITGAIIATAAVVGIGYQVYGAFQPGPDLAAKAALDLRSCAGVACVAPVTELTQLAAKDNNRYGDTVYADLARFVAERSRPSRATGPCDPATATRDTATYRAIAPALQFLTTHPRAIARDTIAMRGVNLMGERFHRADVRLWDFSGACLDRAVFDSADMNNASFERAWLRYADLRWARATSQVNFHNARLDSARFTLATLSADFSGATLDTAWFESADLRGSGFTNARLNWANFTDARFGASLARVDTLNVVGALFAGANSDVSAAEKEMLHRNGACIRDIGVGPWYFRQRSARLRDTTCGLPVRPR